MTISTKKDKTSIKLPSKYIGILEWFWKDNFTSAFPFVPTDSQSLNCSEQSQSKEPD